MAEIRRKENRRAAQAMVSLPALVEGGIAVAIATVTGGFLVEDVGEAAVPRSAFYSTPLEAEAQALSQIRLYEKWAAQGRVRLLKSARDLDDHLPLWVEDRKPGLVLLMEGADPIVEVGELPAWWARGLRMIGLTFGDTRYGVGVGGGSPVYKRGGLTEDGARMLEQMAELGFIWDISHLAEDGVWQGLEMKFPRVCASHANARTLTPTDRHLSDGVIRNLGERGGVIGMVLYNGFLEPRWQEDQTTQVTLSEHLRRQADHFAKLAGWEVVGSSSSRTMRAANSSAEMSMRSP